VCSKARSEIARVTYNQMVLHPYSRLPTEPTSEPLPPMTSLNKQEVARRNSLPYITKKAGMLGRWPRLGGD
ncbi:Hypothetical predicted protein, partial [Marmota monax]